MMEVKEIVFEEVIHSLVSLAEELREIELKLVSIRQILLEGIKNDHNNKEDSHGLENST